MDGWPRLRIAAAAVQVAAALCLGHLCGQELDTALRSQGEGHFTVMDEIENPRERADFLALYKTPDASQKHQRATQFIADYPQSWLLAQAYEAAAKSSIDLGEFDLAMTEGRFSLRLLPENPSLLVPLANVEAQRKQMTLAEQHARDALEYLEVFSAPAGIKPAAWSEMKAQLNASAYFVLGRVYASQGLGMKGPKRRELLDRASEALTSATAWNATDAEIFYLRGMVHEACAEFAEAAVDYAEARRLDSRTQEVATNALARIYQSQISKARVSGETPRVSFEEFVHSLPNPAIPSSSATHSGSANEARQPAYAGSETCIQCHRREFDSWRDTGMAKMLRPFSAEDIMGDFRPGTEFRNELGDQIVRMGDDGRPFFDIVGQDGHWHKYRVDYTIGSKWQQGYVTKLPDGRMQVLPIEYNKLQQKWVNYWKQIDPPGSVRANVQRFPELLPATNYQLNCAICHTSQLKTAATDEEGMKHAQYREPGVNCEMCHGPSQEHVERMQRKDLTPLAPLKAPVDFTRTNNREGVRVCAQCHRQSSVREASPHSELNYSSAGDSFLLSSVSRPYPQFLRKAFYKDGRFRETTFIVEAFTRSACYRRGNAQCADCHDPHPVDAAQNPTSLKFLHDPNEMCLQCHRQFRGKTEAHTHHAANSEAGRCTACHMPRIMNSVLFMAASHQIDDRPDAALTARFGQQESPNACLLCHTGKDAAWVSDKLAHW
ncbi:MAG: cytochrome c3 family protein [Bryobacteraceae bacterium]